MVTLTPSRPAPAGPSIVNREPGTHSPPVRLIDASTASLRSFARSEQPPSNPLGGVTSRYEGPRAEISRDRTCRGGAASCRSSRRTALTFITAIALSFVSLVFQTLVPNMLNGAIDNLLDQATPGHCTPTSSHIVIVGDRGRRHGH